jgi:Magnesium chelatase, subunit ChlI
MGRTILARRLPTMQPPLTLAESRETTRIYSTLGRLRPEEPLLAKRPCRSPHARRYVVTAVLLLPRHPCPEGFRAANVRRPVNAQRDPLLLPASNVTEPHRRLFGRSTAAEARLDGLRAFDGWQVADR